MHGGIWSAKERMSIQSIRRLRPQALGWPCSHTAPAPSESIQRRKSFSKAISGWLSSSSARRSYSASKLRACISVEATSEPQATALRLSPLATLR